MSSQKTLIANKQNAQLSTGPTSSEGKAIVRYNAIKHGLRAEHLLLPDENSEALQVLIQSLSTDLEPKTTLEWNLFELILTKLWRLKRVSQIEVEQVRSALDRTFSSEGAGSVLGEELQSSRFSRLSEYERGLENGLYKAIAQYQLLKFSDTS